MRKRSGYGWLELAEGILLIVLGVFTLIRPELALTAAVIGYGCVAVLTGISDLLFYAKVERFTGFGPTLSLVTGILSIMIGLMLILHPGAGLVIVSILFPLWFLSHCVSRLTHLNYIRFTAGEFQYRFTMIVNIIGIVLAFFMLFSPSTAFFSLGVLGGIYFILLGVDSILLAVSRIGEHY